MHIVNNQKLSFYVDKPKQHKCSKFPKSSLKPLFMVDMGGGRKEGRENQLSQNMEEKTQVWCCILKMEDRIGCRANWMRLYKRGFQVEPMTAGQRSGEKKDILIQKICYNWVFSHPEITAVSILKALYLCKPHWNKCWIASYNIVHLPTP